MATIASEGLPFEMMSVITPLREGLEHAPISRAVAGALSRPRGRPRELRRAVEGLRGRAVEGLRGRAVEGLRGRAALLLLLLLLLPLCTWARTPPP